MPVVKVDGATLAHGAKGKMTGQLQTLYGDFKKDHLE
jgi:hypothetical protein